MTEIVIDDKKDISDVSKTGLEKTIEEINNSFEREFTLEIYYWYDGVDKPGSI